MKTLVLRQATRQQLEKAVALNHQELYCRNAILAGGKVHQSDEITWTNAGPGNESMILFPELEGEKVGTILDTILADYRANSTRDAGCMSLDPPYPADLGVRLLARGFRPGWKPCWMSLNIDTINTNHSSPHGLQIIKDNKIDLTGIKDLPYAYLSTIVDENLFPEKEEPKKLQRFIAIFNGEVVAHTNILLTTGSYGVAGVYNVGVVPKARNRGIAKAILTTACLYAKELGYQYAVLNATGRRMYQQIGFEWIGAGWTWWIKSKALLANPPTKNQIAFTEAVGRGDIEVLEQLNASCTKEELNKLLTNGMSLYELAVHCRRSLSAKWLLDHGFTIRVLDAWDLGWKDKAAELLITNPEQVNDVYGEMEATILHEAANRNDIALARLALSANPDLSLIDKTFKSTALGWAKHLNRPEIIRLIENYMENKNSGAE